MNALRGDDFEGQETQLSLTNRATRLEIMLTFEKYRDFQTGVRGH